MDFKDLENKLEGLTGIDYEIAEQEELAAGNTAFDVTTSKSYMARLAARALKCNPYDIKDLPVKQYVEVTTRVSNFLFGDLAETMRSQRLEKRRSTLTKNTAQESNIG